MDTPPADAVYQDARAAWPGVEVAPEVFAARAAAAPGGAPVRPADLYLAVACETGDPAALAAFERAMIAPLRGILSRAEHDRAVVDEVLQQVRVRVLVGDGAAPPRLASYAGGGSLLSWLKVTALRLHANLRRGERRAPPPAGDAVDDATPPTEIPPERLLLDQRWGQVLRDALGAAMRALPPRERTLLRLHYVEGLALDRIGLTYGVHKSTVSRWLTAARDRLLAAAVEAVRARVDGVDAREVESLCEELCSRLDLSLSALQSISVAAVGDGVPR